mmetsp:Transcript_42482/g.74494  ORF Transcript_42482/g.74494 Transcript_42482/m.74494 type:complete len:1050 (+) Transcript_42482:81-3230(+)
MASDHAEGASPGEPGFAAEAPSQEFMPSMDAPPPGEDGLPAGDGAPPGDVGLTVVDPPKQKKQEGPVVTRLQMLEYLDGRNWWRFGQVALSFTLVLWINFIVIMFLRGDVSVSYDLHEALVLHIRKIVAHPSLSGVALRNASEIPMLCRCSCRSNLAPVPESACTSDQAEVLDFLGELPPNKDRLMGFDTAAFAAAGLSAAAHLVNPADDNVKVMTWNDITTVKDVMFWIEHGLIPDAWTNRTVHGADYMLQGLLARRNLIIGGVRARQQRAEAADDCEGKVSEGVQTFYLPRCRSGKPATGAYGPGQGGFVPTDTEQGFFDVYFDSERPMSDALSEVAYYRKHGWLDGTSKVLHLQAVLLNADVGMFLLLEVTFRFPFGGNVEKQIDAKTIHCGRKFEFQDYIPELIWAFLIICLLRQEISQLCWECYQRRCLAYWKDLWNMLDWLSILNGFAIAFFWLFMLTKAQSISDDVVALPRAPFASGLNINAYHEQWALVLDDVFSLFEFKQYYQLSLFWYTLIIMLRCLKGYLGQAKLAMLQTSIGNTFWDVLHLMLYFFVIFFNFTLGGHILFGAELQSWSTLVKSASASIRMMMGHFEFEEMYEVAPFSSTVWFWSFLLFLVFIFMNFLFAIIADYFATYREAVGVTTTILDDIISGWKDLIWRMYWRRQMFSEGEYKECCCSNPYSGIVEELMYKSAVSDSFEENARVSCLGVKLGRKRMESLSVEGLAAEGHAGAVPTDLKDLQECDAEVMCADHLLEEGAEFVRQEDALRSQSQVLKVRNFVKMLRQHRKELNAHCEQMEKGNVEDSTILREAVERLEQSTKYCLLEFDDRKRIGVFSMAPPIEGLPRPGTLAATEAQMQSIAGQGGLLRSIDNLQQSRHIEANANPHAAQHLGLTLHEAFHATSGLRQPEQPSKSAVPALRDAARTDQRSWADSNGQALMDVTMQSPSPVSPLALTASPARGNQPHARQLALTASPMGATGNQELGPMKAIFAEDQHEGDFQAHDIDAHDADAVAIADIADATAEIQEGGDGNMVRGSDPPESGP